MTPQQRRSTAAGEPRTEAGRRLIEAVARIADEALAQNGVGITSDTAARAFIEVERRILAIEAEAAESHPSVTERPDDETIRRAFHSMFCSDNRCWSSSEHRAEVAAFRAALAASPAGPEPLPLDVERLGRAIHAAKRVGGPWGPPCSRPSNQFVGGLPMIQVEYDDNREGDYACECKAMAQHLIGLTREAQSNPTGASEESRPVGRPISALFDVADDEVVVWRYQREVDDAWIYNEDRYALNEWDDGTEPEQVIVDRQWYETLPEDPGP